MNLELPEMRRYVAEHIDAAARAVLPLRGCQFDLHASLDEAANELVLTLYAHLYGHEGNRVQVNECWPADWWEAFKDRWFPEWALDRWPVRYKRIIIDQPIYSGVCPHIDAPQRTHLEWIASHARAEDVRRYETVQRDPRDDWDMDPDWPTRGR